MALRSDLTAAFMLLTRLPVGRFAVPGEIPDLARCVWAFPIVGLAVSLLAGLGYALTRHFGTPPLLAASWALAATFLLTGGFHEDGLADTADGFGGGSTPARKLDIMRDSRIGSYGALALLLSCAIRITGIAAIDRPDLVIVSLVLAAMTGRSAMVLLLLLLPAARPDGMGASLGRPRMQSATIALAIAGMAPFTCLQPGPAAVIVVLSVGSALATAGLASALIKGYTGDVLGACEVVVECVVLTVLASAGRV